VTEHGFGWVDPAKMKTQAELVMEYAAGQGAKMPEMATLFSNDFSGKIRLSVPQLEKAKKLVEPFRKYVA